MSSNNSKSNSNLPAFTSIFRQANLTKPKLIPTQYKPTRSHIQQQNDAPSFESFYLNPKLEDEHYENYDPPKSKYKNFYTHQRKGSYETSVSQQGSNNNQNSNSPLSKTPDSSTDIGNWIDVPDSGNY